MAPKKRKSGGGAEAAAGKPHKASKVGNTKADPQKLEAMPHVHQMTDWLLVQSVRI